MPREIETRVGPGTWRRTVDSPDERAVAWVTVVAGRDAEAIVRLAPRGR